MPNVTLIDFTGKGRQDEDWHAANLLLFTKNTRLELAPDTLADIQARPVAKKEAALAEMAKTIPSSWEFVDVTFLISGVTRACAQQITRTRNASYSMQSQRVVDVSNGCVTNPFEPGSDLCDAFEESAEEIMGHYKYLMANGAAPQDARGILPMNIQTNLLAKYNLRAFADLVRSRSSMRTQEEYAVIVHKMVDAVTAAWPWVTPFLTPAQNLAIAELEAVVKSLGLVTGSGPGWRIAKAIDLLRKE